MLHRHFPRSASAQAAHTPRDRWSHLHRNEVTEIIPIDGFDDLDDLSGLDFDFDVDLEDSGLVLTSEFDAVAGIDDTDVDAHPGRPLLPGVSRALRRCGPASAARGRLLISAMAAGAVAAAMHTTPVHPISTTEAVPTANASALTGAAGDNAPRGVQVVTAQPATNAAAHNEEFAKGVAFAQERAQREARLQQPLYVIPTKGMLTSTFGYRWGALHAGIDIANAIGTPIVAVADGVVTDVGPTAGYGMWVKLRHSDGTVTLYGHVNTTLVNIGQHAMAGDQIATMGNRGNSTGPHLHFEVLLGGTERIDPMPWLAKRELYVGGRLS